MTEKISKFFKGCLIFFVIVIFITLVGVSIYGARPIQYNVTNKIELEQGMQSEKNGANGVLNKEFDEYKKELKDNYKETIESLNTKFNLIISLLGVAVTVWVGLNIYNVIQRDDIEKIKNEIDNLKNIEEELNTDRDDLKESIEKLKLELYKITEEKNNLMDEVEKLNSSFNNTLSNEVGKINEAFKETLNNEVAKVNNVFNDTLMDFEIKIKTLKSDEEELKKESEKLRKNQDMLIMFNFMNNIPNRVSKLEETVNNLE